MIRSARHTTGALLALPLAVACAVASLGACDRGDGAPSSGSAQARAPGAPSNPPAAAPDAIEIRLEPGASGTPARIRIQVTPFPASDAWVSAMAGVMHRALATCLPAGEPAAAFSLELALEARDARLHAPPARSAEQDLLGCVYKALDQAELTALGPEPRAVRIQATAAEPAR